MGSLYHGNLRGSQNGHEADVVSYSMCSKHIPAGTIAYETAGILHSKVFSDSTEMVQ